MHSLNSFLSVSSHVGGELQIHDFFVEDMTPVVSTASVSHLTLLNCNWNDQAVQTPNPQ